MELRSLLLGTLGAPFGDDVFNSELGFDELIFEWEERWGKGFEGEGERGQHLQALFRYGLASEEYGRGVWYYSFCERQWCRVTMYGIARCVALVVTGIVGTVSGVKSVLMAC